MTEPTPSPPMADLVKAGELLALAIMDRHQAPAAQIVAMNMCLHIALQTKDPPAALGWMRATLRDFKLQYRERHAPCL